MVQWDPHVSDTKQRHGLTRQELVNGEVTGDEVGTNMFPILFRTYMYPWFTRMVTGASSPASMAARRWRAVVLWQSSVTAWPGKCIYGIYEP